jgi:hypothetical protein
MLRIANQIIELNEADNSPLLAFMLFKTCDVAMSRFLRSIEDIASSGNNDVLSFLKIVRREAADL